MFDERNFTFVPKIHHTDEKELAWPIPGAGDSIGRIDNLRDEGLEAGQYHHENHDEASETEPRTNARSTTTRTRKQELLVVGHVFIAGTEAKELQTLWHNREVQAGVFAASLECLFARFAYTIFSPNIFRDFLSRSMEPRMLLVWDDISETYDIERTDPGKCQLIARAARARSDSPTKRQRQAEGPDQDGDIWSAGFDESCDYSKNASSDIDSGYHDGLCHHEVDDLGLDISSPGEEEPERGRTRKRKHEESYDSALETSDQFIGTKRVSLHKL